MSPCIGSTIPGDVFCGGEWTGLASSVDVGYGGARDEACKNGPPEDEEAACEDEAWAERAVAGNGSTRVEAGSGTVAGAVAGNGSTRVEAGSGTVAA